MNWQRFFMGPLRDPEPQPGSPPAAIDGLPPTPPATPPAADPIAALQADVGRMSETLGRVVETIRQQPAPGTPPQAQPARPDPKAIEAEFWKNPLGMTQAIATAAVNQAMQQPQAGADTLADVARKQARDREPKIFDLLAAEIEGKVKGMPPQFHTSVSVWNNAFNMAVGENLDRVLAERAKGAPPVPGTPTATAPQGGPALPSPRAPQAPPEEKLDDAEKDFIKRFGISEAGFRRGKAAYEAQGEGRPNEPSSWDAHITFDSEQKKRREREAKAKQPVGGK